MEGSWNPKTWVAIVLGILLQPFAFLYVNKARLFWAYFAAVLAASLIDWYLEGFYSAIFSIICPIHAYFTVKDYDSSVRRSWYSKWWGIPAIWASIFIPIFLIRSFLYEPFYIPAASMSPTLNVGDNVIVKKLGYGTYGTYGITLVNTDISETQRPERGKIYAFYPPHRKVPFVKRLVAIPGDTVKINGGRIILNGQQLTENFKYENDSGKVYEESLGDNSYFIQRMNYRPHLDTGTVTVPDDSYFFMGDNRDNSADSRVWGFVSSKSILGEVAYVFR